MAYSNASFSLSTARLSLSVLDSNAVSQEYVNWLNDPEVNMYLEARWAFHSLESVKSQVDIFFQSDSDVLFGIFLPSRPKVHIGNVKLSGIHPTNRIAEIGFLIGRKEYWGRGFASEAIKSVCDWALLDRDLRKVSAGAYSVNLGSIKTLEKVGFQREGVLREHVQLTTEARCDIYRFGLLHNSRTMSSGNFSN